MFVTHRMGSKCVKSVVIGGTILSIASNISFAYLRDYELLVLSRVSQGFADSMLLVGGKL